VFKYIKNFIFVFKHVYRALLITYKKMNDPEIKEFAKFRHVLVVAQKMKDCPQVSIARHLVFFETLPSVQSAFDLRDEVLRDEDLYSGCHFEGNPTHHDLIVVSLGNYSDLVVSGIFGEEDEDVDG